MDASKTALAIPTIAAWVAGALYTVSPIDLIPDLIPVLGLVDDIVGLFLLAGFTLYMVYRMKNSPPQQQATPDRVVMPKTKPASVPKTKPEHAMAKYEPMTLEEIRAL